MKSNSLVLLVFVILILLLYLYSGDNSKILAMVENKKITELNLDKEKEISAFSMQNRILSDKEILDKLIDDQLLLIKARELNIIVSDEEVQQAYKEMKTSISFTGGQYVEGEEKSLDKHTLQNFKELFTIEKTKTALGPNIEEILKELRKTVHIKYY